MMSYVYVGLAGAAGAWIGGTIAYLMWNRYLLAKIRGAERRTVNRMLVLDQAISAYRAQVAAASQALREGVKRINDV
jgi:hypothetical protein